MAHEVFGIREASDVIWFEYLGAIMLRKSNYELICKSCSKANNVNDSSGTNTSSSGEDDQAEPPAPR